MTDMVYGVATCEQPLWQECVNSWSLKASDPLRPGMTAKHKDILDAYQLIYQNTSEKVIAYIHDDVIIHEQDWDLRVLREFDDPSVGIVGFAGAPGIGHPNMYTQPYQGASLGRVGFKSNLRNAEQHGARFNGECDAAILDGLALFVRREVLDQVNGWPLDTPIGYFMYDAWICLTALRYSYKIRLVGVDCDHLGGKSTGLNPTLKADWDAAHRYIYEEFQSVLPARVL